MIIDRLAQLDKSQRLKVTVVAGIAVGLLSYCVITRSSSVKLDKAEKKYANVKNEYSNMENKLIGLSQYEERLAELKNQFDRQIQEWFTRQQALQFFENINAMAMAHNLRPISRIISEPKSIFEDEKKEEDQPRNQSLRTQSARVTVAGSYFDIVDFFSDLTLAERRQKVIIQNVHIALAPGENYYPRASFNVVLLVDLSQEIKT